MINTTRNKENNTIFPWLIYQEKNINKSPISSWFYLTLRSKTTLFMINFSSKNCNFKIALKWNDICHIIITCILIGIGVNILFYPHKWVIIKLFTMGSVFFVVDLDLTHHPRSQPWMNSYDTSCRIIRMIIYVPNHEDNTCTHKYKYPHFWCIKGLWATFHIPAISS